jgi:hypothetical protein
MAYTSSSGFTRRVSINNTKLAVGTIRVSIKKNPAAIIWIRRSTGKLTTRRCGNKCKNTGKRLSNTPAISSVAKSLKTSPTTARTRSRART